jgi:hypothetical protein
MNTIRENISGAGDYLQNKMNLSSFAEAKDKVKDSFENVKANDFQTNLNNLKDFAGKSARKAASSDSAKYGAVALPAIAATGVALTPAQFALGTALIGIPTVMILADKLMDREENKEIQKCEAYKQSLQQGASGPPLNSMPVEERREELLRRVENTSGNPLERHYFSEY